MAKKRETRNVVQMLGKAIGDGSSIGHKPPRIMEPQDRELFQSFQANLLSLVSHELRTPLTGIVNALNVMEGEGLESEMGKEFLSIAKRNAQQLNHTLASLLDLASIESGSFHVRLAELDLRRLVQSRMGDLYSLFRERKLTMTIENSSQTSICPVLADVQKLGRAIDICLQLTLQWASLASTARARIGESGLFIDFKLNEGQEEDWDQTWGHSIAAKESGIGSTGSAFGSTVQSEQEFLSRTKEGLGTEFILVHQIAKLHKGRFSQNREGQVVTLGLELPKMDSKEALMKVISSRVFETTAGLVHVAIVSVKVPGKPDEKKIEAYRSKIRKTLFRSKDAVYSLFDQGCCVLVMDDCNPGDVPGIMARVEKQLGSKLDFGYACCPIDGADPYVLLELAQTRIKEKPSLK